MVTYIEYGDIFSVPGVTSYAHGCNCAGAMGRGIALQFRNRWPQMYDEYRRLCALGKFQPGNVYRYEYGNGHIYNLATQKHWRGPDSMARLEYIETALTKMLTMATRDGVSAIAMPRIGAGLGGLRWEDVREVIERTSAQFPSVSLYVVENWKPD